MQLETLKRLDEVDYNIVWDVIRTNVPDLRRQLEGVLESDVRAPLKPET